MKRPRWRLVARRAGLALMFLVLLGNRPQCERRTPTLVCTNLSVTLALGDCVQISNPCDPAGDWGRVDGFRLCDAPAGIFIRTARSRFGTTREVCAASTAPVVSDFAASFDYATPREYGVGGISITTSAIGLFSVEVSASPVSVAPGDPVQLSSAVSGGTEPYSYFWSSNPLGQISPTDRTSPNITVNPTLSVTYTLEVTDAIGNTSTASVSVDVGLTLVLGPDTTINAGDSVQLAAAAAGGDSNYSYSWTPAESLDNATSPTPLANPLTTTTYTVTVTDGTGASIQGQVTITVLGGTVPGLDACIAWDTNPAPGVLTNFNSDTCSSLPPGETWACVSWTVLVDFGGQIFLYQAKPGGGGCNDPSLVADAHELGVSFEPGDAYHVTVEMTSSSGATDTQTEIFVFLQ